MSLVPVDHSSILKALGLNPADPKVQALALVAQRYGLDLILKQVFLIQGTVYVSHAGLLSVAHRSGDLDGIEVEVHEDDKKFIATARIYRKSMSRPFVYTDECFKNESAVKDKRKRAITRAERNALRRAFDVGVEVYEEDRPEPPINLSPSRPELPRLTHVEKRLSHVEDVGALPAGEGPKAPGLEASRDAPVSSQDANPESSPAGPSLDPWRSVVVRCREMGLDDDERHRLVRWATKGRTESSKDLSPKEAGSAHAALHHLKVYGERLWLESSPTKSISSNQPGTESPVKTGTPSTAAPSGDGA